MRTMKTGGWVLIAATVAVGLSSAQADQGKEMAWMERGKDAVRAMLKDPESAQFREVYFHRGVDGVPMTCGQVNSKNSLGGYVGYQFFISAGQPDLTYLENQVSDFRTAWDRFCR